MLHLLVHYADDLRHEMSATFAFHAVQSNIGAWPWQGSIGGIAAVLVWPRLRHMAHAFIDAKLAPLHEHLALLHRHIEKMTGTAVPPKETP